MENIVVKEMMDDRTMFSRKEGKKARERSKKSLQVGQEKGVFKIHKPNTHNKGTMPEGECNANSIQLA